MKCTTFELSDKKVSIGRSESCDIAIRKSMVSSYHAYINKRLGEYCIVDNDSTNGVYVNNSRIDFSHILKSNDIITIANYTLRFVCENEHSCLKISRTPSVTPTPVVDEATREDTPRKEEKPSDTRQRSKKSTLVPSKKKTKVSHQKKQTAAPILSVTLKKTKLDFTLSEFYHAGIKRIKEIALFSVVAHILFIAFLAKVITGAPPAKKLNQVSLNLVNEISQDIEEEQMLEETIPEIQEMNSNDLKLITEIELATEDLSEETLNDDLSEDDTSLSNDLDLSAVQAPVLSSRASSQPSAEFKKRVLSNNGSFKDVEIRATLIWNDTNDLDLQILTPNGSTISYQTKESNGGILDIDKNVTNPTKTPVENIIWKKNAPAGYYRVFVTLFTHREKSVKPVKFKLELAINGRAHHYSGSIKNEQLGEEINIVSFEYENKRYSIIRGIDNNKKTIKKKVRHDRELIIDLFD
ncbi:MAG: FHA domain-containing protein [Lentisphaeraceae bacterium]|nr:FHA domain-containing protein [Lentisphaeraceae bacterium]